MKIKGKKRESLEAFAKRMKIPMEKVNAYQAARRNWDKRTWEIAKRKGWKRTTERFQDIRDYTGSWPDFEGFIDNRISEMRVRAKHAVEYLDKRANVFINNLATRMVESADEEVIDAGLKLMEWNATATPDERQKFIASQGGANPMILGYKVVERENQRTGKKYITTEADLDYDWRDTVLAVREL